MNARHFSLTELVAYGRGELPERLREMIQQHLKDRCPACTADAGFVQHLAEVARRERLATPPPHVVARARAVFPPVAEPAAALAERLSSLAQLVCDSFLQPAPAGVRGALRLDRHLVFADRDLLLDVHIEPHEESERQCITGQVQSSTVKEAQLTGLPVVLVEGSRVVMTTRTNRHGEFVFGAAPRREMALCVVCPDRLVRIPYLPPAGLE